MTPTDALDMLFAWVLRASLYTAVVIVLVLAVQALLGRRLAARWRYVLWGLVIVRALAPALPQSGWSVFNFTPEVARQEIEAAAPAVLPPVVVYVDVVDAPSGVPPATAAPEGVSRPPFNAPALLWLAGCTVFASITLFSAIAFARRLRGIQPLSGDARVTRILDECRKALNLRQAPPVLAVPGLAGPALTGIVRPRIIVPPGLFECLNDDELRIVLTHELAHLRRRDLVAEWLLVIVRTVHWFNPLVWYAVARCRADRELACDELVIRLTSPTPSARRSYGHTILKLAEGMPRLARPRLTGVVGILESRSQLKRRLRMIAQFDRFGRRLPAAVVLLAAVVLASCTLTDRKPPQAAVEVSGGEKPQADDPMAGWKVVKAQKDGARRLSEIQANLDLMYNPPSRRQVAMEAQYIAADAATLAAFKRDIPAAFAGGDPAPGETKTVELDPATADKLLRSAAANVFIAPRLVAFEGECVWFRSGGEVPYIKDYKVVKGPDGTDSREPNYQYAHFGLSLDVSATLDPQATQGSVQLRSSISKLQDELRDGWFWLVRVGEPKMRVSEVKSNASVPLGRTLLVRGLRGSPEWIPEKKADPKAAAKAEDHDILLLIKPTAADAGQASITTQPAPPKAKESGAANEHKSIRTGPGEKRSYADGHVEWVQPESPKAGAGRSR
jgi:beta-lactamase regulating signal transducer with metallopeptidase domain